MTEPRPNIAIVGGGIGGLFAAKALLTPPMPTRVLGENRMDKLQGVTLATGKCLA